MRFFLHFTCLGRRTADLAAPAGIGLALFLLGGCASYPSRMHQAKLDFVRGNYEEARESINPKDCEGGRDQLLFLLERATIKQTMGDFEESNQDFEKAYRVIEDYENRAVVSVRDGLEETKAFLVNETTLPYRGQGFEKILLHAYKALNYLMLGDLEGARVEIRRLDERQKLEREAHEREILQAEEKAREQNLQRAQISDIEKNILKAYGTARDRAANVKNLYLSTFGSYLSGLVYDISGEYDEALIDYRRVISLSPRFDYALIDAVSLGADDITLPEVNLDLRQRSDLIIFFGCGLTPVKREVSIPIPTGRGWLAVAFPVYTTIPTALDRAIVFIDGVEAGSSEILSDVEAQAIRTLVDRIPTMVIRQVIRVAIKATALRAASKESEAGEILMSLYNLISERADLRSWLTLPRNIQALRIYPPVGKHTVKIALTDTEGKILGEVSRELEFTNDQTVLVNIRGVGYTPLLPKSLTITAQWQSLPRVSLSARPKPVLIYN